MTITKIPTRDMSREDWLAARRSSIGGSDAGAVLGLNPYTSPYMLWAEKSGKIVPQDISDKEAVRLGNDLEQYVAERFMEATGKKLQRLNYILKNDAYPWAHANIDRRVVGEEAGFEAKTTSSWEILQQCRNGEFPDTWLCQVTHYLAVTGWEKWYLGVLCLGHGFFWFEIRRNDGDIEALMGAERAFWDGVVNGTPPAPDGSEATQEALRAIYAESDGSTCDLAPMRSELDSIAALDKRIAEFKALRDEAQAKVMDYMGTAERGETDNYRVSWKSSTRRTLDRKRYEAENGKIPEKYYNESASRAFRFTVKI